VRIKFAFLYKSWSLCHGDKEVGHLCLSASLLSILKHRDSVVLGVYTAARHVSRQIAIWRLACGPESRLSLRHSNLSCIVQPS
jgi:hypothetical protein